MFLGSFSGFLTTGVSVGDTKVSNSIGNPKPKLEGFSIKICTIFRVILGLLGNTKVQDFS